MSERDCALQQSCITDERETDREVEVWIEGSQNRTAALESVVVALVTARTAAKCISASLTMSELNLTITIHSLTQVGCTQVCSHSDIFGNFRGLSASLERYIFSPLWQRLSFIHCLILR